jgi:hypothetical protein
MDARGEGPLKLVWIGTAVALCAMGLGSSSGANPANRAAFSGHFGMLLPRKLDNCATCHRDSHAPHASQLPASIAEFPHNPFGDRLRALGEDLRRAGKKADIPTRISLTATEDSDRDGVDNLTEILLGHNPGDPKDIPTAAELAQAGTRRAAFARYLASYRWQPFEPIKRPAVPVVTSPTPLLRKEGASRRGGLFLNRTGDRLSGRTNPIDAFISAEHRARGLRPRPEATKAILLRRVTVDLTGLVPTPAELEAFERDTSRNAYEKVVDRLLASPTYGERWGRHWMDVWRYSDWAGWGDQVRDSKPFIWRWRDWIVESLNEDKGYDRMVQEMLAADELCPEDTNALRATGFLVRNFKLLSREQWMEDVVNHSSKALLGLTIGCAKCHQHMYDPITNEEYYRMRAIFEPHNVRTDRIPGQPDTAKDGLVHAFDADPKAPTYFYPRGDERNPDKSRVIPPGVPSSLGGTYVAEPVKLVRTVYAPDKRDFVIQESTASAERAVTDTQKAISTAPDRTLAELKAEIAVAARETLNAVLKVEALEDGGDKASPAWKSAAESAAAAQRTQAALEAKLAVLTAQANAKSGKPADAKTLQAKADEAAKALAKAEADLKLSPSTAYKPRVATAYPQESTGRRLAYARWLTDPKNPLVARVAVNHIWARHFGTGIVPSLNDFGRNGRPPSMPQLLDWLASELIARKWSMKAIHRLIVTSSAYRMSSTPDAEDLKRDPDNRFVWRMPSRRLEAEAVRDNVLYTAGDLDEAMGGPEIDHNLGLTSKRRSIYLRQAAEKEVEFLKIFDSPSVTECYERKPSVMPQQALALANSELALREAKKLAAEIGTGSDDSRFIESAFLRVISRRPTPEERTLCLGYIRKPAPGVKTASTGTSVRARENLILVLFNHNDFVTVR